MREMLLVNASILYMCACKLLKIFSRQSAIIVFLHIQHILYIGQSGSFHAELWTYFFELSDVI